MELTGHKIRFIIHAFKKNESMKINTCYVVVWCKRLKPKFDLNVACGLRAKEDSNVFRYCLT